MTFIQRYNGYLGSLLLSFLFLTLYFFVFAAVCVANPMEFGNITISPEITIGSEYDDNISLANGIDEEIKEDLILRVTPAIRSLLQHNDHKFSFDVSGDYRKGTSSNLSEMNLTLIGDAIFNFTGGLKFSMSDRYTRSRFDQSLFEEDDISTSQTNTVTLHSGYIFLRRFNVNGTYSHKWEETEQDVSNSERVIDDFEGKLIVPLTWHTNVYVIYEYQQQDFEGRASRNFNDVSYQAGIRWEGPYRFSLFAEGGYEKIDYSLSQKDNNDNVIGEAGVEIKFSEVISGGLSLGEDVYDNLVYAASLFYRYADDLSIYATATKSTQVSFSGDYISNEFESTRYRLQLNKLLSDDITLSLSGSYVLHHVFLQDVEDRDDKTWLGRIIISYAVNDNLEVSSRYHFAQKTSTSEEIEYENNRLGVFLKAMF
jgi:hypothetical protein